MTEVLETPTVAVQAPGPTPPPTRDGAPPSGEGGGLGGSSQVGSPFFADVVRAHYAWERELNAADRDDTRLEELHADYQAKLSKFCEAEGKILEAYWCIHAASAVALTERPRPLKRRLLGDNEIRLHRLSNWLMPRSGHRLVDLLHDADDLAIRAGEILHGTPKRIALRSVYQVESDVLAFLERTNGEPTAAETEEFDQDARVSLDAAQKRYDIAADKVARMIYVSGMLAGVAGLVPLAALAGLAIWVFGALDLHSPGTRAFYACIAAGALGALVSVLSRMASPDKFDLDPDVGRRALFVLGLYRPFVGSIFGLALYFLLESSLFEIKTTNAFATFVVAAFLGGFSERFVKVMLHSAEGSLGGASTTESQPAGGDGKPNA